MTGLRRRAVPRVGPGFRFPATGLPLTARRANTYLRSA
jgi:hypothetical protein